MEFCFFIILYRNIYIYTHWGSKVWNKSYFWALLCSPRLHLFDKKYYKITVFILKCNLIQWCKAEFFFSSLLQSSGSHDPLEIILICCFAAQNISYYYQCWKQLCWFICCGNQYVHYARMHSIGQKRQERHLQCTKYFYFIFLWAFNSSKNLRNVWQFPQKYEADFNNWMILLFSTLLGSCDTEDWCWCLTTQK